MERRTRALRLAKYPDLFVISTEKRRLGVDHLVYLISSPIELADVDLLLHIWSALGAAVVGKIVMPRVLFLVGVLVAGDASPRRRQEDKSHVLIGAGIEALLQPWHQLMSQLRARAREAVQQDECCCMRFPFGWLDNVECWQSLWIGTRRRRCQLRFLRKAYISSTAACTLMRRACIAFWTIDVR